jgi:MFS family permease
VTDTAFCLQLLIARSLNGAGLGIVTPLVQSYTADSFPIEMRGKAFGKLQIFGALGAGVGTLFATGIAAKKLAFAGGMPGWRFALVLVGTLSAITGALTLWFAREVLSSTRVSTCE